jgi:hypothetical protein
MQTSPKWAVWAYPGKATLALKPSVDAGLGLHRERLLKNRRIFGCSIALSAN